MTHNDYTKLILNIKDDNIYFYDNLLTIENIKGIDTKVFHAYLTYTPKCCPKCGHINKSTDDIIKWNFKRNCNIKITKACGYRKFKHLKARVMLIKGLLNPIMAQ